MGLLVWFPLNGNVKNQGASIMNMVVASDGSTLTNTGKVTQRCYGNNSYTTGGYVSEEQVNLGQNQSVFAWVKVTTFNSNASLAASIAGQHRYPTNVGMGMTIKYVSSTTGYLSVNTGDGSSRTFNTYCGSTLLSANTWYHLGYTYDGSTIRLYVNGQLDGSHSFTGMVTPADYFMVGGWSFSGSNGNAVYANYKLNGYINDVRGYNHTLSAKEIEELSKGLCLHYKFNFEDMYRPVEYIEFSGAQYIDSGVKTLTPSNFSIEIDYQRTNIDNADACLFGQRQFGKFTNMYNTYYESAYGNTASGTANNYDRNIVLMNNTGIYKNGTALISGTISSISSSYSALIGAFSEDSGANAKWFYKGKMYHLKIIDNGIVIRDYIPCVRLTDRIAGLYDIVNNLFYINGGSGSIYYPDLDIEKTIADASGHQNAISSTNVVTSDTTNFGNQSASFNGSSSYLRLAHEVLNGPFSVAVRFKSNSSANQCLFCDRGGTGTGPAMFLLSGNSVRFDTQDSNFSATLSYNDGNWHQVVGTYDGSNRKIYVDGVLKSTSSTSTLGTLGAVLSIGGSYPSSSSTTPSGNYYSGLISDWRLYSTAISDAYVAKLYQSMEAIDKIGNLYCNEYNELGSKIEFSKKSVISSGFISEGNDKTALQDTFTEIEYIESSGTQHIDTGLKFNLNTGWYEVKAQPTTASQNGFILGDWTVSNNYYWLYHYQSGSTIRMYATNSGGSQVNFSTGLSSSNTNVHTYYYKDKVMYVDGTQQSSQTSTTFSTPTGNCWLFKANGSSATSYPYKGRIYYAKFWISGKLVRYFIPVKRNRDNALGMLDVVNNVFYTNAGTGDFSDGANVGSLHNIYTNSLMED